MPSKLCSRPHHHIAAPPLVMRGVIVPIVPSVSTLSYLPGFPNLMKFSRPSRLSPPLKALGPDGLHALVFQSNWYSLGPSIIQVIQEIFEHLTIPPSWGVTNLVLISKVAHPDVITQFCPISLCNTIYKLLSRIIVH